MFTKPHHHTHQHTQSTLKVSPKLYEDYVEQVSLADGGESMSGSVTPGGQSGMQMSAAYSPETSMTKSRKAKRRNKHKHKNETI